MAVTWIKDLSPNANTDEVVKCIIDTINEFYDSDFVKRIVLKINPHNNLSLPEFVHKLFDWVCQNIKYQMDPVGWERVWTPELTAKMGEGDCKKMTVLIGAVLRLLKIPFVLKVVSYNGGLNWSHIYVVVVVGKDQITKLIVDPVNDCKYNEEISHDVANVYNLVNKKISMNGNRLTQMGSKFNFSGMKKGIGQAAYSLDWDLATIAGKKNGGCGCGMGRITVEEYAAMLSGGIGLAPPPGEGGLIYPNFSDAEIIQLFMHIPKYMRIPQFQGMNYVKGQIPDITFYMKKVPPTWRLPQFKYLPYQPDLKTVDTGSSSSGGFLSNVANVVQNTVTTIQNTANNIINAVQSGASTVGFAPARGAFLGVIALGKALEETPIKINLATKLADAYVKNPGRVVGVWEKFGGKKEGLRDALKKATGRQLSGIGFAAATVAAAIAAAAPILLAVTKMLKEEGVINEDQEKTFGNALNLAAQGIQSGNVGTPTNNPIVAEGTELDKGVGDSTTLPALTPPGTQQGSLLGGRLMELNTWVKAILIFGCVAGMNMGSVSRLSALVCAISSVMLFTVIIVNTKNLITKTANGKI